jgi:hypothetical protein
MLKYNMIFFSTMQFTKKGVIFDIYFKNLGGTIYFT